jgi:hypothetical protein
VVILALLQCIERLSKNEITDDIECGKVDPAYQVDFSFGLDLDLLVELGDEKFTIPVNDGLLSSESRFRETVADETFESDMIFIVGC